jgi:hypothetical protein
MPMNIDFIYRSSGVILVKVKGWDSSWGIKQYINVCNSSDIPIFELEVEKNRGVSKVACE